MKNNLGPRSQMVWTLRREPEGFRTKHPQLLALLSSLQVQIPQYTCSFWAIIVKWWCSFLCRSEHSVWLGGSSGPWEIAGSKNHPKSRVQSGRFGPYLSLVIIPQYSKRCEYFVEFGRSCLPCLSSIPAAIERSTEWLGRHLWGLPCQNIWVDNELQYLR